MKNFCTFGGAYNKPYYRSDHRKNPIKTVSMGVNANI
jgi:hypothetical protein